MNEIKNIDYIIGILMADGNISLNTRNRGKVALEISYKDKDIVDKLFEIVPDSKISTRTRDTNFKDNYQSIKFANYHKWFRDMLINDYDYPMKDKTMNAFKPDNVEEKEFWRGFFDGDGSLGITGKGLPFISLVTKSENIKIQFLELLERKFGIIKKPNRNKRDDVYNIMLTNEKAQTLANYLYEDSEISLDRKYKKYLEIKEWKRGQ